MSLWCQLIQAATEPWNKLLLKLNQFCSHKKKKEGGKTRNKHKNFFYINNVVLFSVINKGYKGMSLQINYKTSIVVLASLTIFGLQCKRDNGAPVSVWGVRLFLCMWVCEQSIDCYWSVLKSISRITKVCCIFFLEKLYINRTIF